MKIQRSLAASVKDIHAITTDASSLKLICSIVDGPNAVLNRTITVTLSPDVLKRIVSIHTDGQKRYDKYRKTAANECIGIVAGCYLSKLQHTLDSHTREILYWFIKEAQNKIKEAFKLEVDENRNT